MNKILIALVGFLYFGGVCSLQSVRENSSTDEIELHVECAKDLSERQLDGEEPVWILDPTRDYIVKSILHSGSSEDPSYPYARELFSSLNLVDGKIGSMEVLSEDLSEVSLRKKGLNICDVLFKVEVTNDFNDKISSRIIHFEMQRTAESDWILRLATYQDKISRRDRLPITTVAMLSYPGNRNQNDESSYIALAKFDMYSSEFSEKIDIEAFSDMYNFDLRKIADKLRNGEDIKFLDKPASEEAKSWLRFFCTRYLCKQEGNIQSVNEKFGYMFDRKETENLKKVVRMLAGLPDKENDKVFANELANTIQEGQLDAAKKEGESSKEEAMRRAMQSCNISDEDIEKICELARKKNPK